MRKLFDQESENKTYSKAIPPALHANCKQATRPSKEGRQLAGATTAAAAVLGHVTRVGYIAKCQLGTSKGASRRQQLHLKSNWPHHPPPRTHGLPHPCHLSEEGAVCEVSVTTPLSTLLLQVWEYICRQRYASLDCATSQLARTECHVVAAMCLAGSTV